MQGRLYVVGMGAEGYGSLSAGAREAVGRAGTILGVERLMQTVPAGKAERVAGNPGSRSALDLIESRLCTHDVVVLASGDPGFFGIGKVMVSRFGQERVEILPHLSSVQLAFAAIKESWEDALLLSVHGRSMDGIAEAVDRAPKVAILTDGINSPAAVASQLLSAGIEGYRAFVCEEMGGPQERVRQLALSELAGTGCSPLSLLILLREPPAPGPAQSARPTTEWPLGIPDDLFLQERPRRGLITKLEVRLVALGKMGLTPRSVVWDVGAGSGAVAVEAAGLARDGAVYAVERDEERAGMVRSNAAAFGRSNVTVLHGSAPEALEGLPAPDAVFIGGSGGQLPAILELVGRRIRPNGRVVVDAATIETAHVALETMKKLGFAVESTLLQLSRGKELAESLTHFEALDPVFVITGSRRSTPKEGS